jgi:hypothetical protein
MRILYVGMCTGENGFTKAMKKYSSHYAEMNCGEPSLNGCLKIVALENWDILFLQVQTPDIINPERIKAIKENGTIIFNFTGDVRTPLPEWYKELAPHITSTIFTNMNDVKEMRSLGFNSDWMEYGFDPEIYCPEGPVKPVSPIVFMGNNYGVGYFPLSKERIDTVDMLQAEFEKEFGVYGNGWVYADGNFNHSQTEEAAAYRGAKIAINLSHFEYEDYSSDRLLRILGTGTFCINRWFPGAENLPIISYKTKQELFELCEKYLAEDEQRKLIAHMGAAIAHSNFTFDHMVQNVIKLYEHYK